MIEFVTSMLPRLTSDIDCVQKRFFWCPEITFNNCMTFYFYQLFFIFLFMSYELIYELMSAGP